MQPVLVAAKVMVLLVQAPHSFSDSQWSQADLRQNLGMGWGELGFPPRPSSLRFYQAESPLFLLSRYPLPL